MSAQSQALADEREQFRSMMSDPERREARSLLGSLLTRKQLDALIPPPRWVQLNSLSQNDAPSPTHGGTILFGPKANNLHPSQKRRKPPRGKPLPRTQSWTGITDPSLIPGPRSNPQPKSQPKQIMQALLAQPQLQHRYPPGSIGARLHFPSK